MQGERFLRIACSVVRVQVPSAVQRWRLWLPVPTSDGRFHLARWVLLEGHRLAVTAALLALVFVTILSVGTIWTFELQRLLTETSTVQTILDTLLSGIILLVSIVVSINSIVLSHDITAVETQEERVHGTLSYRSDLDELTDTGEQLSHPSSFLELMSRVIPERAQALAASAEQTDPVVAEEIRAYAEDVTEAAEQLEPAERHRGAEFGVLWAGLEFNYGPLLDRLRRLESQHGNSLPGSIERQFHRLAWTFELFAIGQGYFKTLYYAREVSRLSSTLLFVALPTILYNASTTLAIDAGLLPNAWILGLPPLLGFVATTFTLSLAPYLVLTAYTLRLSAVASRTATGGIFSLE